MRAYQAVRPLTGDEVRLFPVDCSGPGHLRFWISRLWDFHLPRDAAMLTAHDPTHFERVLRQRVRQPLASDAARLARSGHAERRMKLLTVPASRGVLWVRSGFRVFFSRPLAFAALFAAFLFGALLLLLVPGFGAVLLLASLPLVSQGFMLGTQRALAGRTPLADVFVEPLRSGREQAIAMLKIGLLYAVASFLIMWLSNLVDGGTFDALQEAMTATSPDQTPDQDRIEALLSDPASLESGHR